MKNLKVSIKSLLPHMAVLLVLVAGILINFTSLVNVGKQTEALYHASYVVKNAADTADAALEEMQKSIFRLLTNASQDIANEEVANAKACAAAIREQVAIIKQKFLGDQTVVSSLEEKLSQLVPMQKQVLNLAAQNKDAEAMACMENKTIPLIKETQEQLTLLTQTTNAIGSEMIISLQRTQRNTTIVLVSLGIVCALFSIGVITYFRRL